MSKLLVVFGATGMQGGSIITAILNDPSTATKYKLRAITRDATKPKAKALADQGVEIVEGDLDDKESLVKAVEGAYAIFAVTDFWATMDADNEVQQGKNIVDAAKAAKVEHFVLSTLPSPTKFTNGKLIKIAHFDSKATIRDYANSLELPSSFYLPGFYMQNLPAVMFHQDDSSDTWVLDLPMENDAQIPMIDIEDTGKYVKAILENKDEWMGKDVYGAERYYTPLEVVEIFKKQYPGQKAKFVGLTEEEFTQNMEAQERPRHIAEEMAESMMLMNKQYGYYNGAKLEESNKLINDLVVTWEDFVKTAPAWKELK